MADRNFFDKEFEDFYYSLGYADGYSLKPRAKLTAKPSVRQKKYDSGYELGQQDRKGK